MVSAAIFENYSYVKESSTQVISLDKNIEK